MSQAQIRRQWNKHPANELDYVFLKSFIVLQTSTV